MKRKSVPMRELVAAVAGPRLDVDTRDSWLRRAARNSGASFRQTKALFYGEITDPHHRTVSLFREAAGRHEARNLAAQFESLAHSLNVADPDFHGDTIAALVSAARALSGLDRARVNREGLEACPQSSITTPVKPQRT